MRRSKLIVSLLLITVFTVSFSVIGRSYAVPKVNELISVDSSEVKAASYSNQPSVSADGRYVAFRSISSLDSSDTDGQYDIYLRDTVNGTTEIISVSTGGTVANWNVGSAVVSYDGRYVVFDTTATNLAGNDTSMNTDIYLRDRVAGTTELVSIDSSGNPLGNASVPSISSDGRFVAYNSPSEVYVRDRLNSTTELISKDMSGNPSGSSGGGMMSCDGAVIVFASLANDLVSGDTNGKRDVFIAERIGATTRITNITMSGNNDSTLSGAGVISAVSCDGNYVTFLSEATNLVADDTNYRKDVFRYSRIDGQTELVSKSTGGVIGNLNSHTTSISGDGRYITFSSEAYNLVSGDTGNSDIFIRDMKTGVTELLSQNSSGTYGNYASTDGYISTNGERVVYYSSATNLVAGDTDTDSDIIMSETGY